MTKDVKIDIPTVYMRGYVYKSIYDYVMKQKQQGN